MEIASICRTCLSSETVKNISDLQTQHKDTCSDIILFCLNIKVQQDSKISKKLCLKCFKKIMSFYKFKLLALKNDAYLKTVETESHIKNEVYLRDDNIKSENESSWEDEADNNVFRVKLEPLSREQEIESDCQSDNEFLSVIKKIKYEFVPEDSIDETKENAPAKQIKGKRGRPPGTTKKKKTVATSQVCEECGKTVKNLREHAIQHMPESARKRYSCKSCDKTFATCTSRNRHIKTKHLGIKKTCPVCNKLVIDVWTHTRLMHDSASLPHACAPCGRRFISQSALDAHTSLHTRDRPHACDCCGKQFRAKLAMQLHRRQVHDKEKSHLCQFCSKSFFKKYHLQVHLRTHTKEKPYKCPECNKSFATSTILNNHRTVHSDVKQHACTLCNMAFARPGYLRVHMISHTKDKKHSCKYCGIKFGRSDHRKRHEYTAHERHLITNLNTKDIASITASDAKRVTNNPKETARVDESSLENNVPVVSYTSRSTEERVDCIVYEKSRSG